MIKPCYKFTGNSPMKQFLHMLSEVCEVAWSLAKGDYAAASEEVVDIQVSCATLLACMGYNLRDRARIEHEVWLKNSKRRYYDKSGD